jgi:hypothetical protein
MGLQRGDCWAADPGEVKTSTQPRRATGELGLKDLGLRDFTRAAPDLFDKSASAR